MQNQSVAAKVQANLQELFKSNLDPGDAYIKFQVASGVNALLSMDRVEESSIVRAEKITTLPGMSESVMGMMSSRDRVFCVFDLAQLLNLPSELINNRQYQIIVLQTNTESPICVGLAVAQLQGIVRLSTEQIGSSLNGVSDRFVDYVSGTVQQDEKVIPILEFNRILQSLN